MPDLMVFRNNWTKQNTPCSLTIHGELESSILRCQRHLGVLCYAHDNINAIVRMLQLHKSSREHSNMPNLWSLYVRLEANMCTVSYGIKLPLWYSVWAPFFGSKALGCNQQHPHQPLWFTLWYSCGIILEVATSGTSCHFSAVSLRGG